MDLLESSINRAIRVLKTPNNYEDYISIKIKPVQGGCCCFHCWPKTWTRINNYIRPCGPLRDEGDVLIKSNNEEFVLECHESGPEIIAYLELGIAAVGLIITLLEFLHEERKESGKIKIIKRRMINGLMEEEDIMEIELPLSDGVVERIYKNIERALKHKKKN